jgi:hypothetical protein
MSADEEDEDEMGDEYDDEYEDEIMAYEYPWMGESVEQLDEIQKSYGSSKGPSVKTSKGTFGAFSTSFNPQRYDIRMTHDAQGNRLKAEEGRKKFAAFNVGFLDQAKEYLQNLKKKHDGVSESVALEEEQDYKVSVEGLPDMYVKANSPSEVKATLRKVVKKPDMVRSVDRVTQSMLTKIFRDKAAGKEETEE